MTDRLDSQEIQARNTAWENYYNPHIHRHPPNNHRLHGWVTFIHEVMLNRKLLLLFAVYFIENNKNEGDDIMHTR